MPKDTSQLYHLSGLEEILNPMPAKQTEAQRQAKVIAHLRRNHPDIKFTVNAFSANQALNKQSAGYKAKTIATAKQQGHESGVPDITILAKGFKHSGLLLEMKQPDKLPLHYMPNNKCYVIENEDKQGNHTDIASHLRIQAEWISDSTMQGFLGVFVADPDKAIKLIDDYIAGKDINMADFENLSYDYLDKNYSRKTCKVLQLS